MATSVNPVSLAIARHRAHDLFYTLQAAANEGDREARAHLRWAVADIAAFMILDREVREGGVYPLVYVQDQQGNYVPETITRPPTEIGIVGDARKGTT